MSVGHSYLNFPMQCCMSCCFFFQAEDGIRDSSVTGVQTCALPILRSPGAVSLGGLKRNQARLGIYEAKGSAGTRWPTPGVSRTRNPAANANAAIIANPYENDPVRPCRYPNAKGPANPATLPTALTIPTVAAAADSLRISLGIAQNAGRNAVIMQAVLSDTTESEVEPDGRMRPSSEIAAINTGTAECQRLSLFLSECQPLISMAMNATT